MKIRMYTLNSEITNAKLENKEKNEKFQQCGQNYTQEKYKTKIFQKHALGWISVLNI